MDTRSNFSNTVYQFTELGEIKKLLSTTNPFECVHNPSPFVRKSLPQTSIFLGKEKFRRQVNDKPRISLENEIEMINFSQEEKIIATKALRMLINDIINTYPLCKFRKDLYETSSEVYKYCFSESLVKIRTVEDLKSEPSQVILSRRHKIHRNELIINQPLYKHPEKVSFYQLINFNRSISNCLTDRNLKIKQIDPENSKKRIHKILKSTRQKLVHKHLLIPSLLPKVQTYNEYPPKKLQFSHSNLKSDQKPSKKPEDPLIIPSNLYKKLISSEFKSIPHQKSNLATFRL